ncbi:hypothetical protein [Spirochaeta cellobiosiphila]|uniref:hypothetical protein n=1 Tax=Spirochaeta cellobiosiphila TaxID=504483 RepID=UPI0003F9DED2|nr:hypothetical protein [Spirochaeta cellobiosiphila]
MEKLQSSTIKIPVKMTFTDEGISFFIKSGKKLKKYKMANNSERYGASFESINAQTLQRMIHLGYIRDIEMSRPEFLSKRQDIMDLSKLISYGTFYRRFDELVFDLLIGSPFIKHWNRTHPGNLIYDQSPFSESHLVAYTKDNYKVVQQVKNNIMDPLVKSITSSDLDIREKNTKIFLCEKYLDKIRPLGWFIFIKFFEEEGFEQTLTKVRQLLVEFIDKSKITEYLALIVMELLLYGENKNIQKFVMERYQGRMDPKQVLYDDDVRAMLVNEMAQREENLYLNWHLSPRKNNLLSRSKLQLSIYNNVADFEFFKENVNDKKNLNLKRKSLLDFYKDNSQSSGMSDLGLYYLSYLSDECQKVGLYLESLVSQIANSDRTVMTLSLLI